MKARNKRPTTLKDVALAAGVHVSTASRALDPAQAHRISESTVERVRDAAARLNYFPDPIATGLKRGTSSMVGLIVADLENPYIGPIARGIAQELEQRDYVTVVAETLDDHQRFERMLRSLLSRRVDAIITTAARSSDRHLLRQLDETGPIGVLVVRDVDGSGLPSVTLDEIQGGALAAEHCAELGHQRVAQLRGAPDIKVFTERDEGFRHAAGRLGLIEATTSARAEEPTVAEGRRLMAATLDESSGPVPTAVFCHADLLAVGAIEEIESRGYSCPQDFSIIGYDDIPLSNHLAPSLTTIRLPGQRIGQQAGELVSRLLDDPERSPASIKLPAELIVRESTAPPAKSS